jgi:hypothetical protein
MYSKTCLILRGFVYKENYLAGAQPGPSFSGRGRRRGPYVNNFFNRIDIYRKLINKLKESKSVDVYLSTYDTTPHYIIDGLEKTNLFNKILIFPELNSYQWTTTLGCLDYLSAKNCKYQTYIILRNDLIDMTDLFINTLSTYNYSDKHIYTLIKEHKRKADIDILQIVPEILLQDYYDFINSIDNFHAHHIFYKLYPKVMRIFGKQTKACTTTENCKFLYTLDGCGCRSCVRELRAKKK